MQGLVTFLLVIGFVIFVGKVVIGQITDQATQQAKRTNLNRKSRHKKDYFVLTKWDKKQANLKLQQIEEDEFELDDDSFVSESEIASIGINPTSRTSVDDELDQFNQGLASRLPHDFDNIDESVDKFEDHVSDHHFGASVTDRYKAVVSLNEQIPKLSTQDLKAMLSGTANLQKSVLALEIFGPPKALQDDIY